MLTVLYSTGERFSCSGIVQRKGSHFDCIVQDRAEVIMLTVLYQGGVLMLTVLYRGEVLMLTVMYSTGGRSSC
jgi:hypothetical protein